MRWLLVAAFVFAGCSKKTEAQGPTCAEVTDHVHAVFLKAYPGHGAPGNRATEIKGCEDRKLSAGDRRCILAAQTLEAIGKCREKSVKEADAPVPPPATPTTTP